MLSFAVIDALNSCSWCGRMEGGKLKVMRRRIAVFGVMMDWHWRGKLVGGRWVTSGRTNLVEGDEADKAGCKGTGGDKDRPGVEDWGKTGGLREKEVW